MLWVRQIAIHIEPSRKANMNVASWAWLDFEWNIFEWVSLYLRIILSIAKAKTKKFVGNFCLELIEMYPRLNFKYTLVPMP